MLSHFDAFRDRLDGATAIMNHKTVHVHSGVFRNSPLSTWTEPPHLAVKWQESLHDSISSTWNGNHSE